MKRYQCFILILFAVLFAVSCGQNTAPPSSDSSSAKPAPEPPAVSSPETEPAPQEPQQDVHVHPPVSQAEYRIPPYFENPDSAEPLPPIMDPLRVPPHAQYGYTLAQQNPRLMAQLPCFCYCDRFGHKSLHSCFASDHAIECDVCLNEAVEAGELSTGGMSPQEIRAIIIEKYHPRS